LTPHRRLRRRVFRAIAEAGCSDMIVQNVGSDGNSLLSFTVRRRGQRAALPPDIG